MVITCKLTPLPKTSNVFKTRNEVSRPRPPLRGRDDGRPSGRLPDGEEDQVRRGVREPVPQRVSYEVHVVDQAGREVRRQAGSSVREVLEERRLQRQGLDGGPQE